MNFHLILLSILVAMVLPAPTNQANKGGAEFHIVIKKSERKLYLYQQSNRELGKMKLIKTYDIALGNSPLGTKRRQGDGATPEGEYYISHKNARSKFYLSLGVSYPGKMDAEAGLKAGLISNAQREGIVSAINRGGRPPQNTALGGDIFIHGGGNGKAAGSGRDWTLGCIALENTDIKELFDLVSEKTPVTILP